MRGGLAILLLLLLAAPAWAQPCGVFKVWATNEVLKSADLNASFQRTVDANNPPCVNDYSATIAQMQTTVNPFPSGVESLPTTLSGELERIRFQLKAIIGGAQWYSPPVRSLAPSTSIQLAEIATPSTPPADNVKLYARDSSGVSVLSYVDAAGTVRTLLTSDISSTVSSLTMLMNPVVPTPPAGHVSLYAISAPAGSGYIAYKDPGGVVYTLSRADEQQWTGFAGLIMTRPSPRVLNLTVDRISLKKFPLYSVNNTLNLDLTGAGGRGCIGAVCDALLPDTTYYIWLLYDHDTLTRSMLATLDLGPYAATPTKLPTGTDHWRLVGAWRTDASSNFYSGILRDTTFSYAEPRLVPGCCAIGSGTFNISDAPVTVIRANLLVKFGLPTDSDTDAIPDSGFLYKLARFRAHFTSITGEAAFTATAPMYDTLANYVAMGTLPMGDPSASPLTVHWDASLVPVQVYVTGWEMQTRDP